MGKKKKTKKEPDVAVDPEEPEPVPARETSVEDDTAKAAAMTTFDSFQGDWKTEAKNSPRRAATFETDADELAVSNPLSGPGRQSPVLDDMTPRPGERFMKSSGSDPNGSIDDNRLNDISASLELEHTPRTKVAHGLRNKSIADEMQSEASVSGHAFKLMSKQALESENALAQALCCSNFYAVATVVWNFAIHPLNKGKIGWDVFILGMVIVTSIYEPYKAAFLPPGQPWYAWVIDLIFYTDIVVQFFSGFDIGYEIIMDKSLIVKHYVGGWFWIDMVSTVQIDLILGAFLDETETGLDSAWLRLLRFLRVLRLLRAGRIIARLTQEWPIRTEFIEAFKFFLYVGITAHFLACLFFLWPVLMVRRMFHACSDARCTLLLAARHRKRQCRAPMPSRLTASPVATEMW